MIEKRYVAILSPDCRRRHFRNYIGRHITCFCIQLEIIIAGKWTPVIRYDTSHGFAHRDYIHPDGRVEKVSLNIKDLNEALTFSENDIKTNWEIYKDKYLKEANENDRKRIF